LIINIPNGQAIPVECVNFYTEVYDRVVFIIITFSPSVAQAQEKLKFSIAEFEADPFDLSARSADTAKYDGDGSKFGSIIIYY